MSRGCWLNLGCGYTKIPGYINCDIEISVKPDIVLDIRKPLPFKNCSVERVLMSHVIEHIEEYIHHRIFSELYRIMIPEGDLILLYPEGPKCAALYAKDPRNEFYKMTLLGRRTYVWDRHCALIFTDDLVDLLKSTGFDVINYTEDPRISAYTILHAKRGIKPVSYEDILRKEIFEWRM